jgi:hypothetical protein
MEYDGRFIHKNNLHFNRRNQRSTAVPPAPDRGEEGKVKFQFEFQNGEVLRLQLYEHLKMM